MHPAAMIWSLHREAVHTHIYKLCEEGFSMALRGINKFAKKARPKNRYTKSDLIDPLPLYYIRSLSILVCLSLISPRCDIASHTYSIILYTLYTQRPPILILVPHTEGSRVYRENSEDFFFSPECDARVLVWPHHILTRAQLHYIITNTLFNGQR